MTKNEVIEMLLHLKEECNKHPKAKSIKCNKWELLEIADYFLDLVGRIEFLNVSKTFDKEDLVRLQIVQDGVGYIGSSFDEVIYKNLAHDFADILPKYMGKYMDVRVIDDPARREFIYKANLCVLKRKEY